MILLHFLAFMTHEVGWVWERGPSHKIHTQILIFSRSDKVQIWHLGFGPFQEWTRIQFLDKQLDTFLSPFPSILTTLDFISLIVLAVIGMKKSSLLHCLSAVGKEGRNRNLPLDDNISHSCSHPWQSSYLYSCLSLLSECLTGNVSGNDKIPHGLQDWGFSGFYFSGQISLLLVRKEVIRVWQWKNIFEMKLMTKSLSHCRELFLFLKIVGLKAFSSSLVM